MTVRGQVIRCEIFEPGAKIVVVGQGDRYEVFAAAEWQEIVDRSMEADYDPEEQNRLLDLAGVPRLLD